ncbi:hypothetical protein TELCIR_24163 [Teladorsagia circumcincta]|uniref:Cation/H+ exchanger domain-containing protein n=1 Tax=Teladorsagia circumcincta TaxID=45464 RepID=A0A2G9T959_TELCI|nr:hypothetical protein TELCIR_24163 [Teladorsagia circumcincta]
MGEVHTNIGTYCDTDPMWNWPQLGLPKTCNVLVVLIILTTLNHTNIFEGIAIGLGMVTAAIESAAIALAAVLIFGWSIPIALMCGVVLAAISPAVTVPVMLDLQSRGLGTRKVRRLAEELKVADQFFCYYDGFF